jgi:hypothetical protein
MRLFIPAVFFVSPVLLLGQSSSPAPDKGAAPAVAHGSVNDATNDFTPLTVGQKINRRALRLIEPVTLFTSAFSAGVDQLRDTPPEWGEGAEGFAKRFGSSEGMTASHNIIALGGDLAFHLDPRYRRMPEGRVRARIWNAISQSFIAYKDSGGRTINVSEIAGNMGSGFIANWWEPAGYHSTQDGLNRGLWAIAFHTGKNVAREFLPDVMHRVKPGSHNSGTHN